MREHGERVVERLYRLGVLGPATIAAHCVHIDGHEAALLAETGTAAVHNPQSNMNNAVGVAAVPAMLAAGVLVGLGTDAMTTDMLEELRAALFVRHLAAGDPSCGFMETVSLLVSGNARIAETVLAWGGPRRARRGARGRRRAGGLRPADAARREHAVRPPGVRRVTGGGRHDHRRRPRADGGEEARARHRRGRK